MSVFVWIGLALAIAFAKTWEASKSIRIIGPVLQIHAILTAIIMLSEDLYTRKIGKEFFRPLYYWRYYWHSDHVGDLHILFWRCRILDLGTFESRISIFYEVNV